MDILKAFDKAFDKLIVSKDELNKMDKEFQELAMCVEDGKAMQQRSSHDQKRIAAVKKTLKPVLKEKERVRINMTELTIDVTQTQDNLYRELKKLETAANDCK